MAPNDSYTHLSIHRSMLRDGVRNEAYREAIRRVVKPGDVVLDVGAGTGILSMFAAQAGARRVYAIERSGIAPIARRIIRTNGMSDTIVVLHQDLEDVDLPEKVDVIVSEWMGGLGVDENMLAPVVMARNRWLKPGGTMVPARVTAMLAPAWVDELDYALEHWRSRPHGLDLSDVATLTVHESHMLQAEIAVDDLIAAPQAMWTHDAATCTLARADSESEARLNFVATRTGRICALACWFHADMAPGCSLTNEVGAPDTHWGRLLLPLMNALEIREGQAIAVYVRCYPTAQAGSEFQWTVSVDGGPVDRYDTTLPRG